MQLLRPWILFMVASCRLRQSTAVIKLMNMEDECVIPDVLPISPELVLEVLYENKVHVILGNKLNVSQVKNPPVSLYWKADPNVFHVLCMTDPDAPGRLDPTMREWHHWLVGNIPGMDLSRGEVLSEYIGAMPGNGTGVHRYVFVTYQQPGKLTFDEPRLNNTSAAGRANFRIKQFAEKYKLGLPLAGNFFTAQFDDNVPTLYPNWTDEFSS